MGIILERQRTLWRAAAERYEQRELVRNEKDALIRKGDWTDAEETSRIRTRLIRKGIPTAAVDAVVGGDSKTDSVRGHMLERILKSSQIQAVEFLTGGAHAARMVGRIVIRDNGRAMGFGTGFLVSPRLVLTNNHVLGDRRAAENSVIEFDFVERKDGSLSTPVTFTFDPSTFFATDEALDFALVALAPRGLGGEDLQGRGWLPLIRASGKILVGEAVNLIQHPEGGPMQVCMRENPVVDVVDDFLQYEADTLQGSSGAPVCNDDWDLAALHHSAVPKRNEKGEFITRSGAVWDGSEDTLDAVEWVANEGVRISRIVAHLDNQAFAPAERALYAEAFEQPGMMPLPAPTATRPPFTPATPLAPIAMTTDGGDFAMPQSGNPTSGSTEMSFFFKVTISAVGGPQAAPQPAVQPQAAPHPAPALPGQGVSGAPATPALAPSDEETRAAPAAALARTLIEERGPGRKPYYDKDEDKRLREDYYASVDFHSEPRELFSELNQLLSRTHAKTLSYKSARLKHLYPWIDLRPDSLELFSIYSDDEMGSEDVVRRELEALARRRSGVQESYSVQDLERWIDDDDEQDVDDESTLEAIPGSHNCEHVVPQSWFSKKQPMKADLHHLFACESRCNSFRSNIPYFDFDPFMESERGDCGRRVGDKFEPHYNHGVVARATLYFLLRYPGMIGDASREFQPDRLETLKRWHRSQKVDLYELHRNAEIAKVQGNRNPLIDYPDLVDNIDFQRGFG